jgi:hypothetical protein
MPSRRSGGNDLVLFSSVDPRPLVNWLCERYGLQTILGAVAEFRPAAQSAEAPAKRAYKRRAGKKGGSKQGSRGSSKKGGAKRGRPARAQAETGAAQG